MKDFDNDDQNQTKDKTITFHSAILRCVPFVSVYQCLSHPGKDVLVHITWN